MTKPASKPRRQLDTGYLVAGLVLAFSLFVGFFVMPQLGSSKVRSSLIGQQAPDFVLPYVSLAERGKEQRLSDLQGKVVVLDFWASWCGPCRAQTPVLERVAKEIGAAKLQVLGVGTSDDRGSVSRFLERQPQGYPSVFDEEGATASIYGVHGLPTLVIVARDGTVSAVTTGVVSGRELTQLVNAALQ